MPQYLDFPPRAWVSISLIRLAEGLTGLAGGLERQD
jgi:hypothetical protein